MAGLGSIVVRVDAGPDIGLGHVMRCIGLAQAWQDHGGKVSFVTAKMPNDLLTRLAAENIKVHLLETAQASIDDARATRVVAESADWLVVDGYDFGASWLRHVSGSARVALWTDHAHADTLPVDLILNQNPHAEPALYVASAPTARLLMGPEFVVLRREFRGVLGRRKPRRKLRQLLVTFGGGTARGAHEAFLEATKKLGKRLPHTILLVGRTHPKRDSILRRAASCINVTARLATDDFPQLVADSDLAVSAAGATLWELASLGVPSLALVIAANQEPLAHHLELRRAGRSLGWLTDSTPVIIAEQLERLLNNTEEHYAMSRAALSLIDGCGAEKVCDVLASQS